MIECAGARERGSFGRAGAAWWTGRFGADFRTGGFVDFAVGDLPGGEVGTECVAVLLGVLLADGGVATLDVGVAEVAAGELAVASPVEG